MTEATTHTIDAPGAVLTYDVRPGSDADRTPLVMVASPMAAAGFTTLAGLFTDRTVVTYDPRQSERSKLTTDADPTPETHADDIHRVIQAAVGSGPVDVLAWVRGRSRCSWHLECLIPDQPASHSVRSRRAAPIFESAIP